MEFVINRNKSGKITDSEMSWSEKKFQQSLEQTLRKSHKTRIRSNERKRGGEDIDFEYRNQFWINDNENKKIPRNTIDLNCVKIKTFLDRKALRICVSKIDINKMINK